MDFGPPLVAPGEKPVAVEPGNGALHGPDIRSSRRGGLAQFVAFVPGTQMRVGLHVVRSSEVENGPFVRSCALWSGPFSSTPYELHGPLNLEHR